MKTAGALLAAAALAISLRFAGLGYGLPHTFNADEPHLVNLAVSFGRGSLRPISFKYPTLWPTVLFAGYGAYYAAWRGLGLGDSVVAFTEQFARDPGAFYLIGRALAALLGVLALAVAWRWESELRPGDFPWGTALLGAAPVLVEVSHTAKPDCLMLALICAAWYAAFQLVRGGGRIWRWACGACLGLALSSQYTAAPAALMLPLAHLLSPSQRRVGWLAEGVAAAALFFLAGSPYVLLDFPRFWSSMKDFSDMAGNREIPQSWVAGLVALNLWTFAGVGSIAGLLAVPGYFLLRARDAAVARLMAGVIAAYAVFFAAHPDGLTLRYLIGCFPALAMLSGETLARVFASSRRLAPALAALALAPGAYWSWIYVADILTPDARTAASAWIESHVPPGETLLLDMPHAGPRLLMDRDQVAELAVKTAAAGSPRARLYQALARAHPGGGYRILRVQRSAADLRTNPRQAALSQAENPVLNVAPGLKAVRAAGVRYVVLSSFGASPARAPELEVFFKELHAQGELVAAFHPQPGHLTGPALRIYKL